MRLALLQCKVKVVEELLRKDVNNKHLKERLDKFRVEFDDFYDEAFYYD